MIVLIKKNKTKEKLYNNQPVFGTFIKMNDPASVEIMGLAGFDFFVADSEHIARTNETMVNLIRASELTDITPIIRIKENSFSGILQAFDAGALGVQIPNIDTKEQALEVIKSAKLYPHGRRGFSPTTRSASYGFSNIEEYIKKSNEESLLVCHCETIESVNNLDEILSLEQIDVIFIGPMDLSQSLGIIGQSEHPKLLENIDLIINKVLDSDKDVGLVVSKVEEAKKLIAKGVKYILLSSDHGFLKQTAEKYLNELR